MHSLRTRLLGLWLLSLAASVAVGLLLVQLYQQSAAAQAGRAAAVVARACDQIAERYAFYASGWTGPVPPLTDPTLRRDLTAAISLALARQDGVEGGIWQSEAGSLAYAYPTYEGTGPKTDLPEAEREQIQAINQAAARDEQPAAHQAITRAQTLLLHACPLPGPIPALTAWTMLRVQSAAGLRPLQAGMGVLLGLMVLMAAWLFRTLLVWGRHVRGIEAALAASGGPAMPALPRSGERELDRIVDALNDAGHRLAEARQESEALAGRVARAERLAGLGRVAAGVAHEIRNPIAAARLQGENALAGDDARRRQAIGDMLAQIDRLDALVAELLAMTQRVTPQPERVDLPAFLRATAARHAPPDGPVRLVTRAAVPRAVFDPAVVGRILDNLLTNALRHAPADGRVSLSAGGDGGTLTFTVADTGPGVPPSLAAQVFEPFVTSRADGTGLGLAIARELADAHGGRLLLHRAGGDGTGGDGTGGDGTGGDGTGAVFVLELPGESA